MELEDSEQSAIVMCEHVHKAEQQTLQQTLVSANMNLPDATPSPMVYAPYGNLYTPMHFFCQQFTNLLKVDIHQQR